MLSMSINHPDIEEFITKKQDLTKVTGANISVKVTDEFMQAVENDKDYILRFPVDESVPQGLMIEEMPYNELWFFSDDDHPNSFFKKVRARELWDTLMHCAWNTAEPGIMFEGAMHNYSPDGVYPDFKMVGTNPCGEIPMGPFDSCRLIHINLSSYVVDPFTDKAHIDEELLYMHSYEAMRLADDLVDLEIEAVDRIINTVKNDTDDTEFKLWSKIKETAIQGRRAGLGFTGLADAIAMLGLKYDSDEGISQVEQLMKVMFKGQLDSNIDMAIERGSFPAWDSVVEAESNSDWLKFIRSNYLKTWLKMAQSGRRNISWSTVAPTGTVSIMTGTSSGIEPVFMPFYQRKRKCMSESDRVDYVDKVGEKYTLFTVVHPNLKRWAIETLNYSESEVNEWSLGVWKEVWKESPYYGSTAPEIDWRQRVKLQGVVQKYITHSISSTVNLDRETTEEEIADIYIEAWKQGLKGITIYRDGCREGVLTQVEKPKTIEGRQAPKRPKVLEADYYQVKVKKEQFIVLVGLLEGKPYEVFAFRPLNPVNIPAHKGTITKVSKMHYSFDSEHINISNLELANTNIEENAATLYSSMLLRHGVDINYIIKTARKVNDNISSFSSAMCRILAKYIPNGEVKGEVCPDCGGTLVREGGCTHCKDCGYSKCL
jgi:ribonucleoside-diphosphate reductase alpha chain